MNKVSLVLVISTIQMNMQTIQCTIVIQNICNFSRNDPGTFYELNDIQLRYIIQCNSDSHTCVKYNNVQVYYFSRITKILNNRLENKYGILFRRRIYLHTNLEN